MSSPFDVANAIPNSPLHSNQTTHAVHPSPPLQGTSRSRANSSAPSPPPTCPSTPRGVCPPQAAPQHPTPLDLPPPRPRSPNQYPVPKKQCRRGVTRLNPSPSLIRRKAIIAASRRLPSRRSHRLHPRSAGWFQERSLAQSRGACPGLQRGSRQRPHGPQGVLLVVGPPQGPHRGPVPMRARGQCQGRCHSGVCLEPSGVGSPVQ